MELDVLAKLTQIVNESGKFYSLFACFFVLRIIGFWISTGTNNDSNDKIIAELRENNYLLRKLLEQQKENKEEDNE